MILNMQKELVLAVQLMNDLFIRGFGGRLRLQIGGGSTLAARYNHRLSTDLDIWRRNPETEADRIYDATAPTEIEEVMAHEAWQGGKPEVDMFRQIHGFLKPGIAEGNLPPEVEGIEVSVGNDLGFPMSGKQRQHVSVAGSILKPQNDEEILWGKLIRMKDGSLTQRDLYDFAVMSRCAPDRVRYALDYIGPDKRWDIADSIRNKEVDKIKPLLRPKWVVDDLEAVKGALLGMLGNRIGFGQESLSPQAAGRWDLHELQATCGHATPSPANRDGGIPV